MEQRRRPRLSPAQLQGAPLKGFDQNFNPTLVAQFSLKYAQPTAKWALGDPYRVSQRKVSEGGAWLEVQAGFEEREVRLLADIVKEAARC